MNDKQRAKPKAVCISDIHFSISTLDLASSALKQAINKATEFNVPLIVAGDLHDTKALLRGEVVNRLIDIFRTALPEIYLLIGNHDLINEKGTEHSLNFLKDYVKIVDKGMYVMEDMHLIPYKSNIQNLKTYLECIPKNSTVICHQGIHSAEMGHYVQDKSAAPKEWFEDFRTISGHYHKAQDIKCGNVGKNSVGVYSYVGSPYTVSFAEANDGPKGFRILYEDGTLELVPTNLRKHIVVERELINCLKPIPEYSPGDLVWLKLRGPATGLAASKKDYIGKKLFGHSNFKFDKIVTDLDDKIIRRTEVVKDSELLDAIIDRTAERKDKKSELKKLWRELVE